MPLKRELLLRCGQYEKSATGNWLRGLAKDKSQTLLDYFVRYDTMRCSIRPSLHRNPTAAAVRSLSSPLRSVAAELSFFSSALAAFASGLPLPECLCLRSTYRCIVPIPPYAPARAETRRYLWTAKNNDGERQRPSRSVEDRRPVQPKKRCRKKTCRLVYRKQAADDGIFHGDDLGTGDEPLCMMIGTEGAPGDSR